MKKDLEHKDQYILNLENEKQHIQIQYEKIQCSQKEEDLQNLVLAKQQRAQNELIRAEIARIEEDDSYG